MGHKDTYAMHINRWLPDIEGELQIQVWRFSADVPAEVIQGWRMVFGPRVILCLDVKVHDEVFDQTTTPGTIAI
jgi:hypothetical protein